MATEDLNKDFRNVLHVCFGRCGLAPQSGVVLLERGIQSVVGASRRRAAPRSQFMGAAGKVIRFSAFGSGRSSEEAHAATHGIFSQFARKTINFGLTENTKRASWPNHSFNRKWSGTPAHSG